MIQIHDRLLGNGDVLHAFRDEPDLLRVDPLHPFDVLWGHAQKEVFNMDFIDAHTIDGDYGEYARTFRIQNYLVSYPTLRGEDP